MCQKRNLISHYNGHQYFEGFDGPTLTIISGNKDAEGAASTVLTISLLKKVPSGLIRPPNVSKRLPRMTCAATRTRMPLALRLVDSVATQVPWCLVIAIVAFGLWLTLAAWLPTVSKSGTCLVEVAEAKSRRRQKGLGS